ncbi:MAG TPA: FAD-dependent oxidoreductase [Candidatus Babeliaceae bacterium]|nr:FAD-dependent oxidoreductase [Candidatus Babeliaceae bacterium]
MATNVTNHTNKPQEFLIIIGGGPAGLTAAIYAARSGLHPLVFEGSRPGGQLTTTAYLENWPGESRILGIELILKMRHQAEQLGARFIDHNIIDITFNEPFTITSDKGQTHKTQTLILATGASPKHLGCPGEDLYWGKGLSCCSVCDGPLYKNKKILVIGGGNRGLQQAEFLSTFTPHITIIDIKDHLTASHSLQKRILDQKFFTIMYNSKVTKIIGNGNSVTHAVIQNIAKNQDTTIEVDGIFLAIGSQPNTNLCKGNIELNEDGYIILKHNSYTSIPGIFAAGDVTAQDHRQAILASAAGCTAALDAQNYIAQASSIKR